jgi:hypothetical protein
MQVSQSVNFERTKRKNGYIAMMDENSIEHTRTVERMAREKSIREGRKTKHLHSDMETI